MNTVLEMTPEELVNAYRAAKQEAAELRQQLAATIADAERYRWLRDTKNEDAVSSMIRIQNYGEEAYLLDGADLDEAIDAAIAAAAGDAGGKA